MYKEMITNLFYKIAFDLDYFDTAFWFNSVQIFEVFLVFLGVKIGAKFLRECII